MFSKVLEEAESLDIFVKCTEESEREGGIAGMVLC